MYRKFSDKTLSAPVAAVLLFALTSTGCLGTCEDGASVLIYPEGVMYGKVTLDDVNAIIEEHLLGGTPVKRLQVPAEVWS